MKLALAFAALTSLLPGVAHAVVQVRLQVDNPSPAAGQAFHIIYGISAQNEQRSLQATVLNLPGLQVLANPAPPSTGDFMMFALLALAAFMAFRFMRSRAQPAGAYRMNNGQQVPASVPPMGGSEPRMPVAPAVAEGRIPADFDVQGFVRNAKMSFIRLQAANDAKDLNDIRDYTTPQVYAAVAMQMQERGDVAQRTEVVSIDAQVMQVVTEDGKMIASVRFTGLVREDDAFNPEPVDEVWHVEKDLSNADSSWLIAGIQQVEQEAPAAEAPAKA